MRSSVLPPRGSYRVGSHLRRVFWLFPPPPAPVSSPPPAGPALLYTNMSNGNGGSTTFSPGDGSLLTIPTLTLPESTRPDTIEMLHMVFRRHVKLVHSEDST